MLAIWKETDTKLLLQVTEDRKDVWQRMEYPFTTEKGETILNHRFLLEAIQRDCGEEVSRYVEGIIDQESYAKKAVPALERAEEILKMAEDAIEELGSSLKNAEKLIEKALG